MFNKSQTAIMTFIYYQLFPTLFLLFCLGFDFFPPSKQKAIQYVRTFITALQYIFLLFVWLQTVLYRVYEGCTYFVQISSLAGCAQITNVFSFVVCIICIVPYYVCLQRCSK
jgi:hypothetical protein